MFRRDISISLLLVLFYFIWRLPDMLVLRSIASAVFPLNSIYVANTLLSPDMSTGSELASIPISPSIILLIFPPGIYALSWCLGSVSNIFTFLFVVQLAVPLLLYHLLRRVSIPMTAILLSLISAYYFTRSSWWAPDWIIQPLMILAVLLFLLEQKSRISVSRLVMIGLLSGLILTLKHNVGVFFAVMFGTRIILRCLSVSDSAASGQERSLLYLLLSGLFAFGVFFSSKLIYFDEKVFYLLPYFAFWGVVAYFVLKNKNIGINVGQFLQNSVIFSLATLLLPSLVFYWAGKVVGYGRYWYSLFVMGFEYLPIWDYGIAGFIEHYIKFQNAWTLGGIYENYKSTISLAMLLMPFVVNCLFVIWLLQLVGKASTRVDELKNHFAVGLMGIMGIFMFFPLEGAHILIPKLFVYLLMMLYIFRFLSPNYSRFLNFILIAMLFPVALTSFSKSIAFLKTETLPVSDKVQKVIGMPMEKVLAQEIDEQVAVVERSVKGNSYYVIDGSGATLTTLMAFVNNRYPQYYLEMRRGILNKDVVAEIKNALGNVDFVLVNYNDYEEYLLKQHDDPFMVQILDFVDKNYVEIDRYEAPRDKSRSTSQIHSFLIMQKLP